MTRYVDCYKAAALRLFSSSLSNICLLPQLIRQYEVHFCRYGAAAVGLGRPVLQGGIHVRRGHVEDDGGERGKNIPFTVSVVFILTSAGWMGIPQESRPLRQQEVEWLRKEAFQQGRHFLQERQGRSRKRRPGPDLQVQEHRHVRLQDARGAWQ